MSRDHSPPLIAHVIRRLDHGGMEAVLVDLVNGLGDSSFRHAVICLAGFTEFRSRLQSEQIEVYDLGKREGKDFASYWRLWRLFRRIRPAIVNTYNIAALDVAPIARLAGSHVVHSEHGWTSDKASVPQKYILLRRLMRPFIERFVAVSSDLAAWLHEVVHVPSNRIALIHNGVDVNVFSVALESRDEARHLLNIPEDAFVVGTVARLDPVKAQEQLIKAVMMLSSCSTFSIKLYIVGEGNERERLEALIRSLNAGNHVILTGASNDIPHWLSAFDVFALPSLNEGISISVLEAMAVGRPVVATRVGGNPEVVVEGQTGRLVEVGDTEALAQALAQYQNDPALASEHGKAGQRRIFSEFTLTVMVDQYRQLYTSLLNSYPPSGIKDAA